MASVSSGQMRCQSAGTGVAGGVSGDSIQRRVKVGISAEGAAAFASEGAQRIVELIIDAASAAISSADAGSGTGLTCRPETLSVETPR